MYPEHDREKLRELARRRMHGIEDHPTPPIVREYVESHDLTTQTVKWLKLVVLRYGAFLGHPVTDADFSPKPVNAWLTAILDEGRLARTTVKSYRRGLLILWRWLYDEDRIGTPPLKVKRVKAPYPVPRAFTVDDVLRLLHHAERLCGYFPKSGVKRSSFFVAIIRTAWDSGLRPCDLRVLKLSDINEQGKGAITQQKTGRVVLITLRPSTLEAIRATFPPEREFIFGNVVSKKSFFKGMRKLCRLAHTWGGIYRIRKGAASALECEHPGFAGRFLGHATPGLAERHYLDPRIVNRDRPLPPALPPGLDGDGDAPPAPAPVPDPAPASVAPIIAAPRPDSPALLPLLHEFISSPGLADTSARYRNEVRGAIRNGIANCSFRTVAALSGPRLVAWIRCRRDDGLSQKRATFLRDAWIRFGRWLMQSQQAADHANVSDCLGHLYAADDLRHHPEAGQKGKGAA